MIALAYVLGPFIGLNAWYAATSIPAMYRPGFSPEGATTGWFIFLVFGGLACLVVELVAVTPLLVAFNRYHWRWFNGWSAAGIGFLLGAVPWLLLEGSHPQPDLAGGVTTCTHGHCAVESWAKAGMGPSPTPYQALVAVDGHWTSAGWASVVGDAAMMGMVGLIAAIIFRLVAARAVRPTEELA